MKRKLTITLDEQIYNGLYQVVGQRRISQFIENLVRPHVLGQDLEAAYRAMAQDELRETETPAKQRAAFPLIRAARNAPRLTDEQIYAALSVDEGLA
ncbi:MAG: hypothetical protein ACOYYJ_15925 [Chloroflexota bacterium]